MTSNFFFSHNVFYPIWHLLAHLSTKCSWWTFVIAQCPASVVRRALSTISLNIFSSWTTGPILMKLGRDVPWVKFYQSCSRDWIPIITLVGMATNRKKIAIFFKIFFSETRRHRTFSPSGPLPRLFIWCPWGQNWPRPGITSSKHRNKEGKLYNSSSLKLESAELWYLVCSIS